MRYLIRTLFFWAISLPLFYVVGLPFMMDKLSAKARGESYTQCAEQLRQPNLAGIPGDKAEGYCHCVSDGLIFTKSDLFDVLQKKQPAAITALQATLVEKCSREISSPAAVVPRSAVQPADPAANVNQPIEIK